MRKVFTRYCPTLKLPTRQSIAGPLLNDAYRAEKDRLIQTLQRQRHVAVITDGWSNTNSESIVNYMLTSPNMRPMMCSSGTTGNEVHTGVFMESELSRVIAEVEAVAGSGKISAVVSDNAKNMKKAGRLLEANHPSVVYNGCSAHALNLLLKDIFSIKMLAGVLKKAVQVVNFVRSRHLLLQRVRSNRSQLPKEKPRHELAVPVATRWYSQEKCIKSVICNKSPILSAFADEELMSHYADKDSKSKLARVAEIIHDKRFWTDAKVVVKLTAPITRSLAIVESDTCSNSMIFHEFNRLKADAAYTSDLDGLEDLSVQSSILNFVANRWDFIRSGSMTVAYLLDPTKDMVDFVGDNLRKTVAEAVALAERIGLPSDVTAADFRAALLSFIRMKQSWSPAETKSHASDPPLDWWLLNNEFTVLRDVAERILSIPTSSAASERSWSVHGFIHTKLRNRLRVASVEKLAFIYSNIGDKKPRQPPLYRSPPDSTDLLAARNDHDDDEVDFGFDDWDLGLDLDVDEAEI